MTAVHSRGQLSNRGGRPVSDEAVSEFTASIEGAVLVPGDPGYDDARTIWNGMVDRRPGLIVRPAGSDDVSRAVRFAVDHDIALAVKGGGHSFPGHSTCDGGLVIDHTQRKAIEVDADRLTARVEPGVLWGELDAATQEHGLAVPGGQISHTGIAGLTLGGGIGWLSRRFGLTSDNLLAVEMVTAAGDHIRASADENAELFWGVRGGGGNFGVVTSFTYRLHPLGLIYGGLVLHPLPAAPAIFRAMRDVVAAAPDELMVTFAFLHSPDGHQCCGVAICYAGDLDGAEAAVAPLLAIGEPVMVQVGPMPYVAVQGMLDGAAVPGRRYYMRSYTLTELADDAIDALTEGYAATPSPHSIIVLPQMGGATARLSADATAFSQRHAAFTLSILGCWEEASDDDENVGWTRQLGDRLAPHAAGVYVNELGDEGSDRIREAYQASTYERLSKLKAAYDPTNVFRLNQNIPPQN